MQSVLPESNLTDKDLFYATGDTNALVRKEVKYRHRDGTSRWVEASIIPITFQAKPALQISCIDISGRRQAQLALEDQQNYSSKLLDMIHSLVILLDGVGRIVSFNPATELLLAKTGDDIHQRNFWELFKLPPHSPLSEENFAQLVDEQRSIRDLDLLVKIDGRPLWLSWSISYLGDRNNNLNYIVLFGVDITERKLRERQQSAIASIATILRSRASRSQVLETVLHEIRELALVETCGIGFPHTRPAVPVRRIRRRFVFRTDERSLSSHQGHHQRACPPNRPAPPEPQSAGRAAHHHRQCPQSERAVHPLVPPQCRFGQPGNPYPGRLRPHPAGLAHRPPARGRNCRQRHPPHHPQ